MGASKLTPRKKSVSEFVYEVYNGWVDIIFQLFILAVSTTAQREIPWQ